MKIKIAIAQDRGRRIEEKSVRELEVPGWLFFDHDSWQRV